MTEDTSKVYVKTDDRNRVVAIEGGYTTPDDLTGWVQIDEGSGDRYNLCQSHYLSKSIYTEEGILRYKLEDGKVVERSTDEIDADRAALPKPTPSDSERLAALEAAMLTMMMTGGASHV